MRRSGGPGRTHEIDPSRRASSKIRRRPALTRGTSASSLRKRGTTLVVIHRQRSSLDELTIRTRRRDGTLRAPVTIWMVRLGDELYVRSVNGASASWFRGTRTRHEGRISAGGVERDVNLVDVTGMDDAIDDAYRTKYRRSAASIIDHITSPGARAATLRLVPHTDDRGGA